jgi:tRNA(Ile)-lysidine synthase
MRLPLNLDLLPPCERLLVAVSGGADSLALLHGLAEGRAEWRWELRAVHVHHGMRGPEADADAEFLAECCAEWGVPLRVERVDVPAVARECRISVEEAGREARYSTFVRLAGEWGCGRVVTAHHADDQAETVLLHLFRGAGIDGMAGMPERRPLGPAAGAPELVRPLLGVRRRELEAYCAAHGLVPRLDVTNLDLQYRRNRIRYELLPVLERFDPEIAGHLVRLSRQAREEQELLSADAARLLESAARELPPPAPGIPLPAPLVRARLALPVLRAAPPALLRRALRLLLRQVGAFDVELSAGLSERLERLIQAGSGAVDLPGCPLRAALSGECLLLEARTAAPPPVAVEAAIPGRTEAPPFGLVLEAQACPVPVELRLPPAQAIFDLDALRPPFQLRAPQTGDRFRPLNAPGTRLLSDLFTDRKIPAAYRAHWPILMDRDGVVWVLGLAVAHRVRIRPDSLRACRLTVAPLATGMSICSRPTG